MALSNHEKAAVNARIRNALDSDALLHIHDGLALAMDLVGRNDCSKLHEAMKVVREEVDRLREEAEEKRLAQTLQSLERYDDRAEQLACLRRMGWWTNEAREAGLIAESEALNL